MWTYSLICTVRNVRPSRNVDSIPACRPKRLPFLTDVSAQWIVSDDDSRIAVLIPATASGSSLPWAGQGLWLTIRMKKYAVKKAPKIITSDMMKSSIPSVGASTREERCAGGGPWCSAWAIDAASKGFSSYAAAVSEGSSWTTCSTGRLVVRRTRSIRSARSHPDLVSGKVEIRMSSTRKYCRAFMIAV